jgi:outer membrane immunogenic protein
LYYPGNTRPKNADEMPAKRAFRSFSAVTRRNNYSGLLEFFAMINLGDDMNRHFGWALASVISLVGIGAASAADLPVKAPPPLPPPVMNWTGFYLGGSLGGAFNSLDPQFDAITGTSNNLGNASSWVGGVNAAALYQTGQLVVGLETAYRWTDLKNSVTCPSPTLTCTQNTPNIFTFGGRVG